jgi:hydrogenase-4 component F
VSLLASFIIASERLHEFPVEFPLGIYFYLDALSVYFILLVNLVAFVASWYTAQFLAFNTQSGSKTNPAWFHFLFNFFHFTMLVVPMVDNLVILWIAVELTTIFSTLLVAYRGDRKSLEAAWKYIIITTTGIIFALLGTLFMANALPQKISEMSEIVDVSMSWSILVNPKLFPQLDDTFVKLSFLFILVGYGTKAGFAPMHTWLPDGHGEAPSPVSALLSGVLLKSALYALLRFYTITNLALGNNTFTSNIFLFSGLLSLVLATPFILKRNKFKRVLAYHSLEHMGIIAFGIGIGGPIALFGALLHALNHALTKALMFLTYGNIRHEYARRGIEIEQAEMKRGAGALKSMPVSGTLLALGGLALVGSPPFNIFMSEILILWAAVQRALNGTWLDILAVVLFLLTITLIFGGLVKHLARLLLGKPPFIIDESIFSLWPLLALIFIILVFGLFIPTAPVDFPELLRQSVCIVSKGPAACP